MGTNPEPTETPVEVHSPLVDSGRVNEISRKLMIWENSDQTPTLTSRRGLQRGFSPPTGNWSHPIATSFESYHEAVGPDRTPHLHEVSKMGRGWKWPLIQGF